SPFGDAHPIPSVTPTRYGTNRRLRQGRFRIRGKVLLGLRLVDKVLVNKPLHGTTLGAGVTKGVPGLQEIRRLLMEFVLEPSEGATPPDRAGQSPARPIVTDPVCEVSHVLVPHIGRQRVDADQVSIVQRSEERRVEKEGRSR